MKKRISALVLALVLCMALAAPAFAYARVDTTAKTSLSLTYKDGEKALENMKIELYKVADMSDAVRFTAQAAFAGVEGIDALMKEGKWAELTTAVLAYLAADESIAPLATANVDANGEVKFADLEVGLYLVTGDTIKIGSYKYTPQSFVTTLPSLDADTDEWHYDVEAAGKFEEDYISPSTSRSLTVQKKWVGDDKDLRPTEIKVQLLENGKPYGSVVVLSQKGGWSHTWNNVSKDSEWSVEEVEVPEGYVSSVSVSGMKITITNTMEGENIPETPPPGGDIEIEDPEVPMGQLPQTGLLQWPIPVMAAVGLALVLVGLISERKRKSEQ